MQEKKLLNCQVFFRGFSIKRKLFTPNIKSQFLPTKTQKKLKSRIMKKHPTKIIPGKLQKKESQASPEILENLQQHKKTTLNSK